MAKATKINPSFPRNFRRTMGRLYSRARKCDSNHEAAKIQRAGYRAQDRARAESDREYWDPMLDEVEKLGRVARASAAEADKKAEAARMKELRELRIKAREEQRKDWRNL